MSLAAKARFDELIESVRTALRDIDSGTAWGDSQAVVRAATAASRAAGFLEGVTVSDPLMAREMIADFESLVLLVESARARIPAASAMPS